jgi:hypothetical protein
VHGTPDRGILHLNEFVQEQKVRNVQPVLTGAIWCNAFRGHNDCSVMLVSLLYQFAIVPVLVDIFASFSTRDFSVGK